MKSFFTSITTCPPMERKSSLFVLLASVEEEEGEEEGTRGRDMVSSPKPLTMRE